MKYDYYAQTPSSRRSRIIRAQDRLFDKILHGLSFSNALEIGPGFGGFASYCRLRGITYRAVEENQAIAESLQREGHDITVANVAKLDDGLGRFDLVFMSHVLEHLGRWTDAAGALSLLLRVLQPGGHLVLLFPDIRWSGRQFYGDYTHTFPTTLRSVRCLCSDLGANCTRSGHYVGRWLRPWRLLWLLHRAMPTGLLPEVLADKVDDLFMANAFCILSRSPVCGSSDPSGQPIPTLHNLERPEPHRRHAAHR